MIPCPKCGNDDYNESRQCPAFGGKPVCITCCYNCEDYDPENFQCRWHLRHPAIDHKGEVYKLDRLIDKKAKQMEHFYLNNKPWVAVKIEHEMNYLKRQRAELLRKG